MKATPTLCRAFSLSLIIGSALVLSPVSAQSTTAPSLVLTFTLGEGYHILNKAAGCKIAVIRWTSPQIRGIAPKVTKVKIQGSEEIIVKREKDPNGDLYFNCQILREEECD